MINSIKPNIGLWISSEPSPESLQIVWHIAGWKSTTVYVNQTHLNVKLSAKLRGKQRASQKSGGAWSTQAPP